MNWYEISNENVRWGIHIGRIFIMIEWIIPPKYKIWVKSKPYQEKWILHCMDLGLEQKLTNSEVELAKNEAISIVKTEIETKVVYLQEQLEYFDPRSDDTTQ